MMNRVIIFLLVLVAVALLIASLYIFYLEIQKLLEKHIQAAAENLHLFIDSKKALRLFFLSFIMIPLCLWLLTGIEILAFTAIIILIFAPFILKHVLHAKRLKMINEQLPDALSMLAGSLRAGTSFQIAMAMVAREVPSPLSQEFAILLRENRLGMTIGDSLRSLSKRLDLEDIDLFASAVSIAKEVGGNLAETLDRLASSLQTKAIMEGKIRALTAQGKMQGWVVGMLPVVLGSILYAIEPETMRPLFTTGYGWAVISTVLALLILGGIFIRKIVSIDI